MSDFPYGEPLSSDARRVLGPPGISALALTEAEEFDIDLRVSGIPAYLEDVRPLGRPVITGDRGNRTDVRGEETDDCCEGGASIILLSEGDPGGFTCEACVTAIVCEPETSDGELCTLPEESQAAVRR